MRAWPPAVAYFEDGSEEEVSLTGSRLAHASDN